jgi:hypothetical protein
MPLNTTFLDIVKFKGMEGREPLNEVFKSNPAFTGLDLFGNKIPIASKTESGTLFKSNYRIGLDDIDPFRIFNSGLGTSQGNYEQRTFETAIAGRYYYVDSGLIRSEPQAGADYLTNRCKDMIESTIVSLERQFYYGGQKDKNPNSTPSKFGYQGLQVLIDPSMVFDAGGTGNNLASAYLINFSDRSGVTWVFGNEGTMDFRDPIEDTVPDPNNPALQIPVMKAYFEFYPGVAFLSRYAASRIVNIDVSTAFKIQKNRTAFTDEMLATAIAMWPTGTPNAIITTKAAGMMLSASRSVTTLVGVGTGGADVPIQNGFASFPKEHNGIPIAYSDALIDNEKRVVLN